MTDQQSVTRLWGRLFIGLWCYEHVNGLEMCFLGMIKKNTWYVRSGKVGNTHCIKSGAVYIFIFVYIAFYSVMYLPTATIIYRLYCTTVSLWKVQIKKENWMKAFIISCFFCEVNIARVITIKIRRKNIYFSMHYLVCTTHDNRTSVLTVLFMCTRYSKRKYVYG